MRKPGIAEYLWISWPLFLGTLGVAGGTVGGVAVFVSWRVMKSELPLSRRYLLTGACSLIAVIATAVISSLVE